MNHEEVLNKIISHTCQNPTSWGTKDDDYAPKTFTIDLHCMTAMITAQWKPGTEFEYEILDLKFINAE